MAAELGESQLSSLLESVPGLANVLRSPVADAIVHMIRAGAGLGEFRIQDARELVQYATRRGLEEVERSGNGYRQKAKATRGRGAVKKLAKSKAATGTRVGTAKTAKGKVKQTAKGSKKTAKKATKRVKSAGKVSKKKRR
jgi:hypothetical protein